MIAAITPVADALANRGSSDSWNLHLDKLSFLRQGGDGSKQQSLDAVQASYVDPRTQAHLVSACRRQSHLRSLLRAKHGQNYIELALVNSTGLLVHLGRASALENVGLATERSTGLPIIPGTSVKGILSTWACWEANLLPNGVLPEKIDKAKQDRAAFPDQLRIFGSNAESGSTQAGELVFLGGFPTTPPRLIIDVLTPHESGKPNPNPFLSLAAGTCWIFPIIAQARSGDGDRLLKRAKVWLSEALTQVGLGAKTAASYGRFREPDAKEAAQYQATVLEEDRARAKVAAEKTKRLADEAFAQERATKLAQLSPEDRAYAEYVEKIKDWTAPAREIAQKPAEEQQHILRFFRSQEGKTLLSSWTNDKGKKRIQNLKEAGL